MCRAPFRPGSLGMLWRKMSPFLVFCSPFRFCTLILEHWCGWRWIFLLLGHGIFQHWAMRKFGAHHTFCDCHNNSRIPSSRHQSRNENLRVIIKRLTPRGLNWILGNGSWSNSRNQREKNGQNPTQQTSLNVRFKYLEINNIFWSQCPWCYSNV